MGSTSLPNTKTRDTPVTLSMDSSSLNTVPLFRSNFAEPGSSPTLLSGISEADKFSQISAIQYDHETYLELIAGEKSRAEKTASQIYREERARQLNLRAQDPAVLSDLQQSGPSPTDFECVATQSNTPVLERKRQTAATATTEGATATSKR